MPAKSRANWTILALSCEFWYDKSITSIDKGADEINAVINLNHVVNAKYDLIQDEAKQLKESIGDTTLKMIIESKILEDDQKANIVMGLEKAGVDYIKTSTGFFPSSAADFKIGAYSFL